jgi:hypothetical protein
MIPPIESRVALCNSWEIRFVLAYNKKNAFNAKTAVEQKLTPIDSVSGFD